MSGVPEVSVLVASRNRRELLAELLRSLDVAAAAAEAAVQVIVADNGSTDETPAMLRQWSAAEPERVAVRVDEPGKARALNRALASSTAPLLAFVDDDEVVAPEWVRGLVAFCAAHPEYDAGVGSVLPPPSFQDPVLRERLDWYRTIAFFDGGAVVRDMDTLYGGNMVLRRRVFDVVGGFDERLGPGAQGGWEDIDLAQRLQRAGFRIGYMPGAAVYHVVDPSRLTLEYFRHHSRVAARSAYLMTPALWRRSVPRLVEAAIAFGLASLLRHPRAREHARGRLIRHAEIVRLRFGCKSGG